jgi:glycosyltransferase involved in cell wall biosynthesis
VLGTQNVESRVLEQMAEVSRNPLTRTLYRMEAAKMRRFEEAAWRKSRLCLTVSDQERAAVVAAGVEPGRVVTVPNGVDLARFSFVSRPGRKRLRFLGGLDYRPYLDALRWFLGGIWPRVREAEPDAELLLAGRRTEAFSASGLPRGATCIGDSADVPSCLAHADALIVPLRIGGGTRLKVLEAMAAGLSVIATTRGGEGTAALARTHLLLADSAQDFAECCVRLLADRELAAKLAANARRLVEDRYSWDAIGTGLLQAIDGLMAAAQGGR